jgi:hypothetical protein
MEEIATLHTKALAARSLKTKPNGGSWNTSTQYMARSVGLTRRSGVFAVALRQRAIRAKLSIKFSKKF